MIKPDALLRRLVGNIICRFENRGLKVIGIKMIKVSKDLAKKHYAEHEKKPFFDDLLTYITSAPTIAMVIEGEGCINLIRKMVGATNPKEADSGTIRGDYSINTGRNVIHASDSPQSAEREINLFFSKSEIFEYITPDENLIYEES
jgi:nucleoside-diphosphate kinase